MRPAKIAAIIGGVILVLIGLALLLPGGFILWAHSTQRDADGYYSMSSRVLSTDSYALTTPDVNLHVEPWTWIPESDSASVRLEVESMSSTPVFVGIGPTDQVLGYLGSVSRDEVTSLGTWFDPVTYLHLEGDAPLTAPGEQDFWVASQEGLGTQTVVWPVQGGNWTAVLMNADGTAGVQSAVSVGARFDILYPIGVGLLIAGLVILAIGVVLIVLGARRSKSEQPPYPGGPVPPDGQVPPTSPVPPAGPAGPAGQFPPTGQVPPAGPIPAAGQASPMGQGPSVDQSSVQTSERRPTVDEQTTPYPSANPYPLTFDVDYPDRPLNRLTTFFRCLWLIPIGIIASLIGTGTVTWHGIGYSWSWAIGGFLFVPVLLMILFRKKYPRWWYDWNLNLTRFLMRVAAYAQLLRDEYPSTDEEQAVHVDFPYPDAERLSRGMPLVKWFLAIPHWIVLYFLWIGAIVCIVISWFAILFTGRYPRGLFDYVVGVNRWTLRVDAYAILLVTDEYPPFSLSA